MKVCSKCGNVSQDTSRFCGFCGNQLVSNQVQPIRNNWQDRPSIKNQQNRPYYYQAPKKHDKAIWYIAGAGLITLVCLLSIILVLPQITKKDNAIAKVEKVTQTIQQPTSSLKSLTTPILITESPPTTESTVIPDIISTIGQDIQIGKMRWKILEVIEAGNTIKRNNPTMDDITASGKFLKVKFEVENKGKDPNVWTGLYLIDSNGEEYGICYDESGIPNFTLLTDTTPNFRQVISCTYDVPIDVQGLKAKISYSEFCNAKTGIIDLGIK